MARADPCPVYRESEYDHARDRYQQPSLAFRFRQYRTAFIAPAHLRNPDEAVSWYFVDWLTAYSRGFEICCMLRDSKRSKATYIIMVFDPIDEDIENERRALQAGADGNLVGRLSAMMQIYCVADR